MGTDSLERETTQPRPAIERVIAALWKDVLELSESPAPTDNFFDLGGDSTAMVMVELRIQEELSVEIPPGAVLTAPTVRDLARLVEERGISAS